MSTININGIEFQAKWSLRALFAFEELTEEAYNPAKTFHILAMFYCILLVSNRDFMDWNDFLIIADKDKELSVKIKDWFESCNDFKNQVKPQAPEKKKRLRYRLKRFIKFWS